ncbi:hypothetical protein QOZ80_5AG0361320 [Eleusine coracana subsp. coracana]|nr:hypothetical protein QOZ80_5AG0361320 [Eleusine coracana subsp. coracana]
MAGLNLYSALGVSRNASAEEICAAFLKLAANWQPDELGDMEAAIAWFQQIQQAYKALADPTTRELYDAGVYDPTAVDNRDPKLMSADALKQVVAMTIMEKKEEGPWGVIFDKEFSLPQNKKDGSSSSSPMVRVDVTFTNGSESSTSTTVTSARGTAGSRAGAPAGRPPRRRLCPSPILNAKLKFPQP